MIEYPQVVLFGSIQGAWRETHIIPVLEELKLSYFNPVLPGDWTRENGDQEAELMAHCETIIMVINDTRPGFTSLAETGWAALGAQQRGQHFILQMDRHCEFNLPESLRQTNDGQDLAKQMRHYVNASRHLVYCHAQQFQLERFHLVEDLDGVVATLRSIYV